MNVRFKPMTEADIPLWFTWSYYPHVSQVWFGEQDEPRETIYKTVSGNGYDYPFIIYLDETPIGFIQCSDLDQYHAIENTSDDLFANEAKHSFSIDIFIGESAYLDKGYGVQIMQQFITKIFNDFDCQTVCIDPSISNPRAIRCYEKAGFHFVRIDSDHTCKDEHYVMKLTRQQHEENK